jgi:hypothetical protein
MGTRRKLSERIHKLLAEEGVRDCQPAPKLPRDGGPPEQLSRYGTQRAADYGIDLLLIVAIVALCGFMIGIEWGFRIGP